MPRWPEKKVVAKPKQVSNKVATKPQTKETKPHQETAVATATAVPMKFLLAVPTKDLTDLLKARFERETGEKLKAAFVVPTKNGAGLQLYSKKAPYKCDFSYLSAVELKHVEDLAKKCDKNFSEMYMRNVEELRKYSQNQ